MTQELTSNTNRNLTLSERLSLKKSGSRVLLLDVSGSMYSDCEPGKSKIDALRDVVNGITHQPKMFAFSYDCAECTKDTIPPPNGGTKLGKALAFLESLGHNRAIVITDGMVDDPDLCLEMAKKGLNIQIFYIGAGDKPKFLEELANAAGGNFCTKEDIAAVAEITGKLQLLLGSGDSATAESGGPICL